MNKTGKEKKVGEGRRKEWRQVGELVLLDGDLPPCDAEVVINEDNYRGFASQTQRGVISDQ